MTGEQTGKTRVLDRDQAAVRIADTNATVSAGAGSGKTTVLAERYVRLVCDRGIPVDSILTLTFTRKAAAEMYSRIYQRLSESDHKKAAEQLKRFDQARISTLDSFCTSVCRGASYQYGIPGDFRMDEMELARTAEDAAINIIMKYRDEPVIHRLVSSRTFDDVARNIFADLGVNHISVVDKTDFEKLAESQVVFLESEINILWKSMEELCTAILVMDNRTDNATVEKAKEAVRQFPRVQPMGNEVLKKLNDETGFLRSGRSFRTPASNVTNAVLVELRDYAIPLKEQAAKLETVLGTYSFKEDIIRMGYILNEYAERFQEEKRKKGILSFTDTAELAVAILREDRNLRNYYKGQYKAIMIDEFQDNNRLQKELLYLLAEREDRCCPGIPQAKDLAADKLFFVGDEKQSIYRFRGADVSVFRGLSMELEQSVNSESRQNPVSLVLRTNYRSHPELVRFFNVFFPEVFGKAEYLFEAEYKPMIAGKAEESGSKPRIEIHLQEISSSGKTDEDGSTEDEKIDAASSEAVHAAARIIEGVKAGEFSFNDVAVLFRSTTHQDSYERCFRKAGIPFSAADPRGVFAEAVVNDFYAILRLALFRQDTNAYGTVLRSPFVRIGDTTFLRIMLESPEEPFPDDPPDHWFQSDSDRARYIQGLSIFNQLKQKIDVEEIPGVFSFLWYETPYRTDILNNPDTLPLLEHFDYLYNLALDAGRRRLSMTAFLDELAPLVGTYSKAENGEPETGKNGVTLMTVHKSKGLEFKVLIIADAGSAGRPKSGAYFMTSEFGPVINMKSIYTNRDKPALNYIYEYGKEDDRLKSEAELKRLFYVAATRAEERLMIFGSRKVGKTAAGMLDELEGMERLAALLGMPRETGRTNESRDSFMDLLYIAVNKIYQNGHTLNWIAENIPMLSIGEERRRTAALRSTVKSMQSNNKTYPGMMPAFYDLPGKKYTIPVRRMMNPSALEAPDVTEKWGKPLPPFDCDKILVNENIKKAFGTLCHSVIEKLFAREEPEIPDDVLDKLRKEDLKQGEIKSLLSAAAERGRAFLDSDLGKRAISADRSEMEYSFYLPLNPVQSQSILVKGIMDLIFEHDQECIIVDFKTDQYMKPEIHQIQMDTYRLAAGAFSSFPVKIMLVYLRSMEAVQVDQVMTGESLFSAMEQMLKTGELEYQANDIMEDGK